MDRSQAVKKYFHGFEPDGVTARYFVWRLHGTKGWKKDRTERHKIKAHPNDDRAFEREVRSHEIGVK